ncbi:DUF4465 domain-containing protein [Alistipes sp. D31t1_170403_E11]|uniref:DUF4465 domain-containing protein n=1 Tax=Alistipes sp. D31t1_170403_E11 TaxID=2787128 RepID=UPI00189C2F20|nr:DUF4465 domain-containing protein [Alistipes sp. D31t1_170403_E11]
MMKKFFLFAFAVLLLTACSDEKSDVPPVAVTGISLDKDKAQIVPGETLQLAATLTPGDVADPVAWSSDDEDVVTVSDTGLVEAVASGTAVVTASCGDFSARCTIRVDELISFEASEKMTTVDGLGVTLGTISVVSGKNTDTYSNVCWAKEYTEAGDIYDDYDQLYYAGPYFSTADDAVWFSSYYCDGTLYDARFDTWGGFVLSSNANRGSSGGVENQFEAYAESGAGGSAIFAVCYDIRSSGMAMPGDYTSPQIDFTGGACEVVSIALANSGWTYHYFKGREGDSYVVNITGKLNDVQTGVVECPLVEGAGKVDSWKTFDLTALGKVDCLTFTVKSSDRSAPYYFCVDDIILKK